jgi:hypothetical protein
MQTAGVLEWWSNGVMKRSISMKFGLSLFPTLQYSSTPKELAAVSAKPLNSDLASRTRKKNPPKRAVQLTMLYPTCLVRDFGFFLELYYLSLSGNLSPKLG